MNKSILGIILALLVIGLSHAQWLETTIYIGDYPCALAYNSVNNKIYCANRDSVIVIDGVTNQIVRRIAAGIHPERLVYNPTSNKIYCYDNTLCFTTIIDGATDSVITSLWAGEILDFVWNSHENKVYCANCIDSTVTVIDGVTDSVVARIVVSDHNTKRLLYNPTSNKIYCTKYNSFWGWDSTVTVIDGAADTIITSITVGNGAFALGCSPQNNKVYCNCYCEDYVGVIDGATDSVISTVATGGAIWYPLVHNPTDNKMYCVNWTDNVTVIDCATDSVITIIDIGNGCRGFVYNPTNNKVYCASYNSCVTIICGTGDTVVTTIGVDGASCAFAMNPIQNRVYVANAESHTVSVIRDSMTAVHEDAGYDVQDTRFNLTVSPNPFTHTTEIRYSILDTRYLIQKSELAIYDVSGRLVRVFSHAMPHAPCAMQICWDGTDQADRQLPSGVYFVQLIADEYRKTKKVLLMR